MVVMEYIDKSMAKQSNKPIKAPILIPSIGLDAPLHFKIRVTINPKIRFDKIIAHQIISLSGLMAQLFEFDAIKSISNINVQCTEIRITEYPQIFQIAYFVMTYDIWTWFVG